jgi:hypothetical protein
MIGKDENFAFGTDTYFFDIFGREGIGNIGPVICR